MGSELWMKDAVLFAIQYNLKLPRLVFVLVLAVGNRLVFDGFTLPNPWWMVPVYYLLTWVVVVLVDCAWRPSKA
jgi:hypothetical protein